MRAEREFGLVVGGALILLSSWWLYRAKFPNVVHIVLLLGAVLVLLGLVFPKALIWPNRAWLGFAEVLSFVATRIILAFVFFAVVTPIGVVKRMFGWVLLHCRVACVGSDWQSFLDRQG